MLPPQGARIRRILLPPYHGNSISCVGNGLDRSANLPIYWGRLPHSVREMSRSDRGRPPPSAGGTRKARDGGANHIKIHGRAWKPAPTNGAPSRRPLRSNCFFVRRNGLDRSVNTPTNTICISLCIFSQSLNSPLPPRQYPKDSDSGTVGLCPLTVSKVADKFLG